MATLISSLDSGRGKIKSIECFPDLGVKQLDVAIGVIF